MLKARGVVSLLLVSAVSQAAVLDADGSPGLYGTPYVRLGPSATPVWENYRKRLDTNYTPVPPGVSVVQLPDPDRVSFTGQTNAFELTPSFKQAFLAVGLLLGTTYARSSYAEAQPVLVESLSNGVRQSIDVRLGFLEHLANGGGAPLSTFVSNQGGEDEGDLDLYAPNWGVDGVYMHLHFTNDTLQWVLKLDELHLVSATSTSQEQDRQDYIANAVLTGMTDTGAGTYQLADTGNTPLTLRWAVTQEAASTYLTLSVGASGQVRWLLDDGVSLHGLTDPGNSDGIPYQGGALDLDHVVPAMFLGWGGGTYGYDPQPTASLEMGIMGGVPQLSGLPEKVHIDSIASFQVSAYDSAGQLDQSYPGTVHFESTDSTATLPADYTFTPQDHGVHSFEATFRSAGLRQLKVMPVELPVLSSANDIQVSGEYQVGFNCSTAGGLSTLATLATVCALLLSRSDHGRTDRDHAPRWRA